MGNEASSSAGVRKRSQSLSAPSTSSHFSDFSFFPDRFSADIKKSNSGSNPTNMKDNNSNITKLVSNMVPVPAINISHRNRSTSGSDGEGYGTPPSIPSRLRSNSMQTGVRRPAQGLLHSAVDSQITPQLARSYSEEPSKQSQTTSGQKLSFFDYSLIPDKMQTEKKRRERCVSER